MRRSAQYATVLLIILIGFSFSVFTPLATVRAAESDSESENWDDFYLDRAWEELSFVHGVIPGYDRDSERASIIGFASSDRNQVVVLTGNDKVDRIWLWDISQEQSYLLHESPLVITGIHHVALAPWDPDLILIFRSHSVGLISIHRTISSGDISYSKAVNFTRSKIDQVLVHPATESVIYSTAAGDIHVIDEKSLSSEHSEKGFKSAAFTQENLRKIWIQEDDPLRLWSHSPHSIMVWDIASRRLLHKVRVEASMLSEIALLPILNPKDLDTIFVITDIGKLMSYSLSRGEQLERRLIDVACAGKLNSWLVSPDRENLILVCDRDIVRRYSLQGFDLEAELTIEAAGLEVNLMTADELVVVSYADVSEMIVFDSEDFEVFWNVSEFCDHFSYGGAPCQPAIGSQDFKYFSLHHDQPLRAISSDGKGLLIWDFLRQSVAFRPSRVVSEDEIASDFAMHPYDPNLIVRASPNLLEYWDFRAGAAVFEAQHMAE